MPLNNTTILSGDGTAGSKFGKLMKEQNAVKVIVLGDNDKSKEMIELVDHQASFSKEGFKRISIHCTNQHIYDEIKEKINSGNIDPLAINISNDLILCINPEGKATYKYGIDYSPSILLANQAYVKAGL